MDRKEAIKIVRGLYEKSLFLKKDKEAIETLIPEIKDDEDEKIRKAIINVFATHKDYEIFFGVSVEDILAYLEKQKPAEWREEDEGLIDLAVAAVEDFYDKKNPIRVEIIKFLKSLRPQPKQEWGEKDERMLERVIDTIGDAILECDCDDTGTKARFALEEERKWLKSLPERLNRKED